MIYQMATRKNKKNKRESGKVIVVNEETLIREVESRPTLYDKSLKGYRKSALRHQQWKEVSEVVGSTVDECRRRWRSLRDAFSKHYKYLNRVEDSERIKRKKWVFYDQMSFMAPFLDNTHCEIDDTLMEDYPDNSDEEDRVALLHESDDAVDSAVLSDIEIKKKLQIDTGMNNSQTSTPIGEESQFISNILSKATSLPSRVSKTPPVPEVTIPNAPTQNTKQDVPTSSMVPMCLDSDEKFLMSCAPTLRRFTAKQNALARLKIQHILYNIEFESDTR